MFSHFVLSFCQMLPSQAISALLHIPVSCFALLRSLFSNIGLQVHRLSYVRPRYLQANPNLCLPVFPISCASFGLCYDSNVNLISFFIIYTRLSLFGSTYITLMAQNSNTIRIIFLPKCTQKNYDFYAVFYTFFCVFRYYPAKQNQLK